MTRRRRAPLDCVAMEPRRLLSASPQFLSLLRGTAHGAGLRAGDPDRIEVEIEDDGVEDRSPHSRSSVFVARPKAAARSNVQTVTAIRADEPCEIVADIELVLDGSSSISPAEFNQIRAFARGIVDSFVVAPAEARIGLVQFSTQGEGTIEQGLSGDAASLGRTITRMVQLDGATDIQEGLALAGRNLDNAGRDGVPHVVVLITDGADNQGGDPVAEAERLERAGAEVFAIGVGPDAKLAALEAIASDPDDDHVFWFDDPESLVAALDEVVDQLCAEIDPIVPAQVEVTIEMDPATDTGESDTDAITRDVTPTFGGTTDPEALVELFGALPGQDIPTKIGETTADGDGLWFITTPALIDGDFTITAVATLGAETAEAEFDRTLVIDTIAPRVVGLTLDAAAGRFTPTFQDERSGMGLISLNTLANYALVPFHRLRAVVEPITAVEVQATDDPTAPQSVQVFVGDGRPSRGKFFAAKIASGGIEDLAGNPLDGEFDGQFPSGNGEPGGNFGALLTNAHNNPPPRALTPGLIARVNRRDPNIPLGDASAAETARSTNLLRAE